MFWWHFSAVKEAADADKFASATSDYQKVLGSEDTYNNYISKCTGQFVCCTGKKQYLFLY